MFRRVSRSDCKTPPSARASTVVANDVASWGLFAVSLKRAHRLHGPRVIRHAAYFGIGGLHDRHPDEEVAVPFRVAFPAAGVWPRSSRSCSASICCAPDQDLPSPCSRWPRADRVGDAAFSGMTSRGGEQGLPEIPTRQLAWIAEAAFFGSSARATTSICSAWCWVAVCYWALHRVVTPPFGRMLSHHPREPRARRVHRGQRAALRADRVGIAGMFAGLAGGSLRHLQPGRLPGLAYWTKSSRS